jgi:hypothetical protein
MSSAGEISGAGRPAFPEKMEEQAVDNQVNVGDSNDFISSDLSPGQLPEAERRSLVSRLANKVVGKVGTALSVLGFLASTVSGVITVCVLAGVCCTPAGAIIGTIVAVVSLVGIVCDVVNKATDKDKSSPRQNATLVAQVVEIVKLSAKIAKGILNNIPVVNIIVAAISFAGTVYEVISRVRDAGKSSFFQNATLVAQIIEFAKIVAEMFNSIPAVNIAAHVLNLCFLAAKSTSMGELISQKPSPPVTTVGKIAGRIWTMARRHIGKNTVKIGCPSVGFARKG